MVGIVCPILKADLAIVESNAKALFGVYGTHEFHQALFDDCQALRPRVVGIGQSPQRNAAGLCRASSQTRHRICGCRVLGRWWWCICGCQLGPRRFQFARAHVG